MATAGIQAEHLMSNGKLVPDTMILRLIRNALTTRGWLVPKEGVQAFTMNSMATSLPSTGAEAASPSNDEFLRIPPTHSTSPDEFSYSEEPSASFILDGFPRTAAQAEQLSSMLPINMVIHIHTPSSIIMDRICNRWIHAPSGRVYNTTFNAPKVDGKDDVTGEVLTQRADDAPEVWKQRLEGFEREAGPLLDFYKRRGVLWRVEGESSDAIAPGLLEEFGRRFGA